MIRVWKDHHSPALLPLISDAWRGGDPLIVCSPLHTDYGFLEWLPKRMNDLPEKPVLGVFTSGTSSGKPRLALYSRKNIERSLDGIFKFFDFARIDSVFCYPQPFHVFGLTLGYVASIEYGWRLIEVAGRYSSSFHDLWLDAHGARTLTLGAPVHFQDLVAHVKARGVTPRASYSCVIGGAPVSPALWREARDTLKIERPSIGYGCTEASPGITHHRPGLEPLESGEIGQPLAHLDVRLVPGQGLEFSGESLCLAIVEDGELVSPKSLLVRDDVRLREDGMLVYHGRTDLVVNRGGQKISLERLENELKDKLGCELVCVSIPHERLGQELGVLLKPRIGQAFDGAMVVDYVAKLIGARPDRRAVVSVSEFPLNASAKICRRAGAELVVRQLAEAETP